MLTVSSQFVSLRGPLAGLFVAVLSFLANQPAGAQTPATPGTCADTSSPPSIWTAQYGNLRQSYNSGESLLTSGCISNGTVTLAPPAWSPLQVDTANIPYGSVNPVVAQPLYLALVPASKGLPHCPIEEAAIC